MWDVTGVTCSLGLSIMQNDLVLLALCASALRRMLSICSYYARDHGLLFNPCKTQLIYVFVPLRVVFFCHQLLSIILCSLTLMKSFILVMCFRLI